MTTHPSNSAALTDLTDRTIGDYHVLHRLGRGGMADVYLARQCSLKRNVAFKVLKPELAGDSHYVKRFHREAQAAAALVQANIVQIYEVGEQDGIHYIAQEYVSGRNLKQYLMRYGAVEPLMAITILKQVAAALQRAAEMNVVHRDIKPENIMLSTSGEVKVADFGLARVNDEAEGQLGLTKIGITMGTPLYMSPEQAEGKRLDTRSDIYSLGATVYHILAGHPPFDGENAISIAVKQVNESAIPLAKIRPDAPQELNELVHRMMTKDPDKRPATPSVLLQELRKVPIDENQDWEMLVEKIASKDPQSGEATVPDSKLAVTRQLQSVMRGQVTSWWKSSSTLLVIGACLLLAGGSGLVGALLAPPVSLFDGVESRAISESIPRQPNVVEQYRSAFWAVGDAEPHWKAVATYFPPENAPPEQKNKTAYYNQLASERLAEIYLERKEYAKAQEIYDRFANAEDLSRRINVIGWAGQALILDANGQVQKVIESLDRMEPHLDKLSGFLKPRIGELFRKHRPPTDTDEPSQVN